MDVTRCEGCQEPIDPSLARCPFCKTDRVATAPPRDVPVDPIGSVGAPPRRPASSAVGRLLAGAVLLSVGAGATLLDVVALACHLSGTYGSQAPIDPGSAVVFAICALGPVAIGVGFAMIRKAARVSPVIAADRPGRADDLAGARQRDLLTAAGGTMGGFAFAGVSTLLLIALAAAVPVVLFVAIIAYLIICSVAGGDCRIL